MGGISNFEIKKGNKKVVMIILKNNVGVFLSKKITSFIDLHNRMISKGCNYSLLISNTDRSDKAGTYWWSILDFNF